MDEIKSDPVDKSWANEYGFTLPELDQIQPGYYGFDHFILNSILVKGFWILACAGYIIYVYHLISEYTIDSLFSLLLSIATTTVVSIVFELAAFACMCSLVRKNNDPLHLSTVGGVVSIVVMGGMLIWFSVLAHEVDSVNRQENNDHEGE